MTNDLMALALPAITPVFPLTGVLLLPRARLPLHIFEPRYRAMMQDAMLSDQVIAMVQPRDPESVGDAPELYDIACLGRIIEHKELEDGRWTLTLEGVIRFRIQEELAEKDGYRRVRADYSEFSEDITKAVETELDRDRLLAALGGYLKTQGLGADEDAIGQLPDEPLVNALAMACPFLPAEKQALLEAPSFTARAELLEALMQLAIVPNAANDDEPPTVN